MASVADAALALFPHLQECDSLLYTEDLSIFLFHVESSDSNLFGDWLSEILSGMTTRA